MIDIKHINHAIGMLRPGGRLVALCANGPRQQAEFKQNSEYWADLPAGSFKEAGTGVNVAMMVWQDENEPETKTDEDPEKQLRETWTAQGVPKERQDAIIDDVTMKAQPGYMDQFFPCLPGLSQAETFALNNPTTEMGTCKPFQKKTETISMF